MLKRRSVYNTILVDMLDHLDFLESLLSLNKLAGYHLQRLTYVVFINGCEHGALFEFCSFSSALIELAIKTQGNNHLDCVTKEDTFAINNCSSNFRQVS